MTESPEYRVRLDDLERAARVPVAEQVESVDLAEAPPSDPRGESPDRDWFHSGG